jgi:hypothetical protein
MPANPELAAPLHHVFVDFENVHQVDVSVIGARSVNFTILLGANQTRLDAGLVEKLMEHASSVQLIRLASSGRNALDLTLAYYLGRTVSVHPSASIHIISKDTGFDPLVEHLRSRHIHARRHDSFATLPFARQTSTAKAQDAVPEDPLIRALGHLRNIVTTRPKKKGTLVRILRTWIGKDATEADAAGLMERLQQAGHVTIGEKDAVVYHI